LTAGTRPPFFIRCFEARLKRCYISGVMPTRLFAVALLVAALNVVMAAQELTGTIEGTVRASNGPPPAGLQVRAVSANVTVTTDPAADGSFMFTDLPLATYRVQVVDSTGRIVATGTARLTPVVPAQTITKSSGCPSYSGVVCFYDSRNFNNYLTYKWIDDSCNFHGTLDPFRNRVESVRNRTNCHIYLVYYCGTSRCYQEVMRPHSDDGTIATSPPANAARGIDQRHAAGQARAGERGVVGPAGRIRRSERGNQPALALQLGRDLLLEMPPQQQIRGKDGTDDRGSHEQPDAREQPRGESHVRRRRGAGVGRFGGTTGSRNR